MLEVNENTNEVSGNTNEVSENTDNNLSDKLPGKKSHVVTIVLSLFLGLFGCDRYYLGKIGTGFLKMITFGGFGIWYLIDIILVLTNQTLDVSGQKLEGQNKRNPVILTILSVTFLDRFYLGQPIHGVIKFLSIFVFVGYIWWVYDIYLSIKGGRVDANNRPVKHEEKKYQSVALILSVMGGFWALDKFYLEDNSLGLIKLFIPTFGLWTIIDIIGIITNSTKDKNGNPLVSS